MNAARMSSAIDRRRAVLEVDESPTRFRRRIAQEPGVLGSVAGIATVFSCCRCK